MMSKQGPLVVRLTPGVVIQLARADAWRPPCSVHRKKEDGIENRLVPPIGQNDQVVVPDGHDPQISATCRVPTPMCYVNSLKAMRVQEDVYETKLVSSRPEWGPCQGVVELVPLLRTLSDTPQVVK